MQVRSLCAAGRSHQHPFRLCAVRVAVGSGTRNGDVSDQRRLYSSSVTCSPQSASGRWSPGTASVMERWVMKWPGGAVPVPLVGGGVDDVARADLFDLAAARPRRYLPTNQSHLRRCRSIPTTSRPSWPPLVKGLQPSGDGCVATSSIREEQRPAPRIRWVPLVPAHSRDLRWRL